MSERLSLSRLREQGCRCRDRLRVFFVPVCILSGIYILAMSAILRANYNYIDDMDRVFYGYQGWGYFGRYLSNFLSNLIHADAYLTDVSPLPQLIACVLLGAASVVVLRLLTERDRFTPWEYIAVLPLGLCPYMLACLSFKYDAPYMALSVLASAAPLLLANAAALPLLLASFAGTMAMCTTYQASAGILPMLAILLAFRRWRQGERWQSILRFVLSAAAGYCAALILFMLLLGHPTAYDYVDTAVPSLGQFFPRLWENLISFFGKVLKQFDKKWLVFSGLVCLGFLWVSVRDTSRNRAVTLLLALAAAAVTLLLSFGVFPILAKPLVAPRSMYGIGACLAFWAVSAAAGKKAIPVKLVCLALSWCFFVFAFTLGNGFSEQKTYTEFRIEEVIDSFKVLDQDLFSGDTPVTLQIKGDIGRPPALRRSVERFPMLDALIPSSFGGWTWNSVGFMHYYGLPEMTLINYDKNIDLTAHLPLLDETLYHAIYGNGSLLVIELK